MAISAKAIFPHFCVKCGLVSADINKLNPHCPTCWSHEIIMYGEREPRETSTFKTATTIRGHMTRALQDHWAIRCLTRKIAELQWAGTVVRHAESSTW
jgi:hypothetical protein